MRSSVWFSKLSKFEKEDVKTIARNYITADIQNNLRHFLEGLPKPESYIPREYERSRVEAELDRLDKIAEAFRSCTVEFDTLDEIVKCVKDSTHSSIVPESAGVAIATSIRDRRKYEQGYRAW